MPERVRKQRRVLLGILAGLEADRAVPERLSKRCPARLALFGKSMVALFRAFQFKTPANLSHNYNVKIS